MPDITIRKPRIIDPGYRVPATQPEDTICARVYIPNDNLYIAAFWGHLFMLTQWLAWERGGTKARDAAEVWKSAWELSRDWWDNNIGACGDDMDVRQSPTVPCILEKDTGEGWEQFANLALCAPRLRIRDGIIQQETEPGVWEDVSPGDEQFEDRMNGTVVPAWTSPPAGETGNCLAAANSSAYVNVVAYEIANAMGAATEFAGMLAIILGYLTGIVGGIMTYVSLMLLGIAAWQVQSWNDIRDYDTTDDLSQLLHCLFEPDGTMTSDNWSVAKQLIANEASGCGAQEDCTRRWNLLGLIVDILGPVGMSRIAAASGISTYDCTGDCYWEHEFDFTVSNQGWTADTVYDIVAGSWQAGTGWRAVYSGSLGSTGAFRLWIKSPTVSSATYQRGLIEIEYTLAGTNYWFYQLGVLSSGSPVGSFLITGGQYGDPPEENIFVGDSALTGDRLYSQNGCVNTGMTEPAQGAVGGLTVSRIKVWGSGTNPWE